MRYVTRDEYIESYGYFLIDEAFNARQMYMEMIGFLSDGEIPLTESAVVSLNEAVLDNIKNFVITMGKRISEAITKFIEKIEEFIGADKKWLAENQGTILANQVIKNGAIIDNFYKYTNISQVINTSIVDDCNQTILEANKDKWENEEGYVSTKPDLGIAGFTYDANSGNSLQDQIQTFLRGEKVDNMPSEQLTPKMRKEFFEYCLTTYPAAKTSITVEREKLKNVAANLDSYIATKRSETKVAPQPTETTGTQTTQTTQQTVASGAASASPTTNATGNPAPTNAAFDFEPKYDFFNEVDIKNDNTSNNTNGEKQNTTTNVNQKVTGPEAEAKKEDETAAIAKAIKTYFNVNSKKLSAKMNVCTEAYRNRLKLLKWYVGIVKKKTDESKNQKGQNNQQQNQNNQQQNQNNNGSMADAFS